MATPIVSGAIALLLEKNPNMRPEAVKLACIIHVTGQGIVTKARGGL